MRQLTRHKTNDCNRAIALWADEPDPNNGGASHAYFTVYKVGEKEHTQQLSFQRGPIKEVGTNGTTHEVLLTILIDQLESFQAGPYASPHNAVALEHLRAAFDALERRARDREARGVEGTHTV